MHDQRGSKMAEDGNQTTTEDIEDGMPADEEAAFCDMPWKRKHMWSSQLGEIEAMDLWLGLKQDAKPSKSPRTGPAWRQKSLNDPK